MNRRMHDSLPSRRLARWLAGRRDALVAWLRVEANRYDLLAWLCLAAIFGLAALGLYDAVIAP